MDDNTGDDAIGKDWLTVVSADKAFDVVKIANDSHNLFNRRRFLRLLIVFN